MSVDVQRSQKALEPRDAKRLMLAARHNLSITIASSRRDSVDRVATARVRASTLDHSFCWFGVDRVLSSLTRPEADTIGV